MGGCLFQWCTVALYPNVLVVSIKKNRRRDWFGWGGVGFGLQRIFLWIITDLLISLLAGTRRPSHVAGVAGVETTQNVFSTQKDTASAQSLKETVQQRKKLGGTLRFGRYYLLPVIIVHFPGPGEYQMPPTVT